MSCVSVVRRDTNFLRGGRRASAKRDPRPSLVAWCSAHACGRLAPSRARAGRRRLALEAIGGVKVTGGLD